MLDPHSVRYSHFVVFSVVFYHCRVGLEVPKIEVRYEHLNVEAKVQTGERALPTLINVARDTIEVNIRFTS